MLRDESARAAILIDLGEPDEGEAQLRHASERLARELGPAHHEVAAAIYNLGDVAWEKGQSKRA